MKNVYIIMTQTGTMISKTIKIYTKRNYNHVSVTYDNRLIKFYSFGRKKLNNPFFGGFIEESPNQGLYKIYKNTKCKIYKIRVSDEQHDNFVNNINQFIENREKYKYNMIGIFTLILGIYPRRRYHYYCTQFVAKVLQDSKIIRFQKNNHKVLFDDIEKINQLELIYEGNLHDIDHKKIKITE